MRHGPTAVSHVAFLPDGNLVLLPVSPRNKEYRREMTTHPKPINLINLINLINPINLINLINPHQKIFHPRYATPGAEHRPKRTST